MAMLSFFNALLAFPFFVFGLAGSAMGFAGEAFSRAASSGQAQTAALIVAFLAGVSEMLGQSVILVLNRVALYRFLASLAFTGVTYVVTALAWALCAIAVAPLTRLGALTPSEIAGVIGVVSLAFAPRLFGVLSLAPYFGQALGNVLEAWAMALVIFGLHTGFGMPLGPALFCGAAGWLVSFGLRSFLGHLLAKPIAKLRLIVSGSPLDKTPQQILDDLAHRLSGGGAS